VGGVLGEGKALLLHQQCSERREEVGIRPYNTIRGWLAVCLYQQGDSIAARRLFQEAFQDAIIHHHQRAIAFIQWRLAVIVLDEGKLEDANQSLTHSRRRAEQFQDRECLAHILFHFARLHIQQGDLLAARAALVEAIDLFERLALRHEYKQAFTALEQVKRSIEEPIC
jgi:tetratricopeptide (TPR) repeat protein